VLRLDIPEEDRKPLVELFLIDPKKRDDFLKIIEDPASVPHRSDFSKHLQGVTEINSFEAEEIIRVLFTIYAILDTSGEKDDSITLALIDALKEFDDESIKTASNEDFKLFQDFFKKILSLHDSLGVRAKAFRLAPQHQHLFINSELYSDIRPVFRPDDPEIKPTAAVIIHSLKIVYREGRETKIFYIGLDGDDLHNLKDTIERAIKKHNCLKTMVTDCGVQCIGFEEDN